MVRWRSFIRRQESGQGIGCELPGFRIDGSKRPGCDAGGLIQAGIDLHLNVLGGSQIDAGAVLRLARGRQDLVVSESNGAEGKRARVQVGHIQLIGDHDLLCRSSGRSLVLKENTVCHGLLTPWEVVCTPRPHWARLIVGIQSAHDQDREWAAVVGALAVYWTRSAIVRQASLSIGRHVMVGQESAGWRSELAAVGKLVLCGVAPRR